MTDSQTTGLGKWRILVALVAILVFANAQKNELVYDASFLVTSNKTFNDAAKDGFPGGLVKLGAVFHEGFWDGVNQTLDAGRQLRGQNLYRPLMMYSLGSLYLAFGNKPVVFNLANLALHVLAALLVAQLAWLLSRRLPIALIAGLLFAAHPLHSEAVAYVAGLGETQSVMLALAAMLLYGTAARADRWSWPRLACAWIALAAAVFTKESAAVVLVLLPLLDLARGREAPTVSRRLIAYAGFAAVIAFNVLVRYQVLGELSPDTSLISRLDNPVVHEGFMMRLATGVTLYMKALHLFLLPIGQSADYSFNQLPIARSLAEPAAWSAFLVCALMTICGLLWLRRWPVAGFGLLAFLFAFGPVSNIPLGIGTVFGERLTYMPSVGLSLAAAAGLAAMLAWCQRRSEPLGRVARAVMIFGLCVLGFATVMRNRVYASNETLYTDMVKTAPESARAHYQHGELERGKHYEGTGGDLLRAVADFRQALHIMPDFFLAWVQLGIAYGESGEYQQAIDTLTAIKNKVSQSDANAPFRAMIDRHLAQVYARFASNSKDPAEVQESINQLITMLEELHKNNPDDIQIVVELCNLYLQVSRIDDARRILEPAILGFPASAELKAQITQVYAKQGDLNRARTLLPDLVASTNQEAQKVGLLYAGVLGYYDGTKALQEDDPVRAEPLFRESLKSLDTYLEKALNDDGVVHPQEAEGYFWRGQVQQDGMKDAKLALEDYQRTVQSNPNHPDVYIRMSECLILLKRYDAQSKAFFTEVEKLYPDNPYVMLGHATVLSRSDRHAEAAELLKKVIELGVNGVNPHALLAKELIDDGHPDQAITMLDEAAASLGMVHPEINNVRGVALLELQRYDDAIQEFERAANLARQDPQFGGRIPHLMFQQYKTMLRVPGKESAGYKGLTNLDQMIKNAQAATRLEDERRALNQLRPYILFQQSWARSNVAELRDDQEALSLLEHAVQIAEEDQFVETLAGDLYPALVEAYEQRGDVEHADNTRERMNAATKKLRG